MLLVFLILLVVTVCVTIVCTYFLLNAEDYRYGYCHLHPKQHYLFRSMVKVIECFDIFQMAVDFFFCCCLNLGICVPLFNLLLFVQNKVSWKLITRHFLSTATKPNITS